jgi:hypothetical protein
MTMLRSIRRAIEGSEHSQTNCCHTAFVFGRHRELVHQYLHDSQSVPAFGPKHSWQEIQEEVKVWLGHASSVVQTGGVSQCTLFGRAIACALLRIFMVKIQCFERKESCSHASFSHVLEVAS